MDAPKAGQRLRCDTCGTDVVVVKAGGEHPRCCGELMSDPSKKESSVE
jgi:hypothetical protein